MLAPRMGTAGIMLATSLMYLLSFACYTVVALRPAPGADGGDDDREKR
ncbi:putative lipoprotein [Bordetella bronchiseptica 980-2]|nr:putative lipoprotein [Bordetella bronchiseptica 980-2]